MGFTGRKPGSGAAAGRSASVIVSPILVSPTSLMAAMRMPTSPGPSAATSTARGASTPTRVTRNSFPVAILRLRLHALRGVDHQDGALAGGQAARDLVGEVDVAGRVDQVEDIVLAVARAVGEADRARLDGDAALALELHVVEELRGHLARRDRAGRLEDAVRERGLPVVDVGDDREVADVGGVQNRENLWVARSVRKRGA